MMADGTFGLALLEVKRGVAQQSLHATGFSIGIEGMQAMGAVMLLLGCALLLLPSDRHRTRAGSATAALLVFALVVSPQLQAIAAFVGGHMFIAVLLLALVMLLDEALRHGGSPGLGPACAALVVALVVTRPEGGALVALALLGATATRRPRGPARAPQDALTAAWVALGLASVAWAWMLASGATSAG